MRFLALIFTLLCTPLAAQDRVEVDVELFLAVDVSRSMQPFELEIQRRGYATALASSEVQAAISGGPLGQIALTYVEWAGAFDQRVIVPWTLVSTPADAQRIADTLTARFDDGLRRTSISAALTHAAASIEGNRYAGLRRVIDISGDGPNNMGAGVTEARDQVLAQGITINGLPLMTRDDSLFSRWDIPDLDAYYTACVIGGPGAFVVPVTDWAEFEDAVRRKLVLEIGALPERVYRAQATGPYNCRIGEEIWERNRDLFALP
ncbi:DUF1194 domain-containing protein [Tateyamaria sp. SN6-1]|uniref:DUF1194 domain-containing protein n=1 Tax=Tateyamaria sp. SN6-1 TaxID=3092148 RepID=UPI0039F45B5D